MASATMTSKERQNSPRSRGSRPSPDAKTAPGLKIAPLFCPQQIADPFDTVQWDRRTAQIKGENGSLLFEQPNCEIPSTWTQLATNVVVSKYFYGEVDTPERETSVRQLIHRVSRTIADWGTSDGYFASPDDGERFYRELTWLCLHQHGAFNSPVWFNVGLYHQYGIKGTQCNWHWDRESDTVCQPENPYEHPQGSACFIQSVDDHMESIMQLARSEAMLFKFGSGTGTDLSTIRSHREKLSGGGKPSGPLSFMRVYDQIAAVVKSGGKTRRAAKMQSLKIWHPDILEFIECKAKEEAKARVLIEKGGYESNFNGEAYSSIMFQNANLSVRVTDDFLQAVEKDEEWATHWVTEPTRKGPVYRARDLLNRMAENAWQCGDPGVQYDTTINRWHTCPNSGRINASNPCVTGDTLVATQKGLRRIDSMLDEQPMVIGADGELHEAKRVFYTGRKRVYRLRTAFGYEVKLTEDHLVRVLDEDFKPVDVPAKELRGGDYVQLGRVELGTESFSDSEELGKMIALFGNRDDVRRWLRDKLKTVGRSIGRGGTATFDTALDFVFQLDRSSVIALVRGFLNKWLRKPYDSNDSPLIVSSPSLGWMKKLQLLLLGFGITSKLEVVNVGASSDEESGSHTRVRLTVVEADDLRALLNGKNIAIRSLDGFYDVIDECPQLLGEEDVFDLTEPVTNHFVANGIVVHNCSEYMFLDDTACNLASINLMKFRQPDGAFDVERFQAACRIYFIAQEILVDHASYPTKQIAANSHRFRPLGLGYSNLGSILMTSGTPYDSDAARGVCGAVTALLHGAANLASAEIAAAVGPFDGYADNREPMLGVMQMHRDAVDGIDDACPGHLKEASQRLWDKVLEQGRKYGFRNAQATVLAPTGTISFLMDCDTTGIEPDIALVKYKQLAGGGMLKIVNQCVPLALETLGYKPAEIKAIIDYIADRDTIEGAPGLRPEHLPVFDCAFPPANGSRSILWEAHVRMMAAAQPFLSGAISKTVNMPRDTTPRDIAGAYLMGGRMGLKALAIYRDGSKESQPLSTTSEGDKAAAKTAAVPRRERLPDTRKSITHKFNVAGHEGYLTVGQYDDGRPGELFITMAKEGSTIGGLMDAFGTAISLSLQYGVPLEVLVNKFSHTRFEPMGHTKHPDIRIAKSLVDYIFRWMGVTFLPGYREANRGPAPKESGEEATGGGSDTEAEPLPAAEQRPGGGLANGRSRTAGDDDTTRTSARLLSSPGGRTSQQGESNSAMLERAGVAMRVDQNAGEPGRLAGRGDQFARFQTDAPSCDNCGAITVRNGNCYLCHNCGNSMGCS